MNALRRIHRSLVPGGVLLDLQPTLTNAPVVNANGILGYLDEREFRAFADRVNAALEETIKAAGRPGRASAGVHVSGLPSDLGLKRRAKGTLSLGEYLAQERQGA